MSILKPFTRQIENHPQPEAQNHEPRSQSSTKPLPAASAPQPAPNQATPPDQPKAIPIEHVRPVVHQYGWWPQTRALILYMTRTEVHTYAFSVAANTILALFPFIVLILTISAQVFHSASMTQVVWDLMHSLLPVSQDFVMRNMTLLAHPHKGTQVFSIVMLLVTTTGVFLPLEVALNQVWGVTQNRNYLMNQLVSLGLAAAAGILVLASVGFTTVQREVMSWIFFGHTQNVVFTFITGGVLRVCAVIASILLFFLIYWLLPNRKIPASAVLPTAVVVGIAWEIAKYLYVLMLPRLDFESVYGPFRVTVGLMMWAFLSGLLLLAGAHFSANRYALKVAREAEAEAPEK
jgi:YihY family inner membrane protein